MNQACMSVGPLLLSYGICLTLDTTYCRVEEVGSPEKFILNNAGGPADQTRPMKVYLRIEDTLLQIP